MMSFFKTNHSDDVSGKGLHVLKLMIEDGVTGPKWREAFRKRSSKPRPDAGNENYYLH